MPLVVGRPAARCNVSPPSTSSQAGFSSGRQARDWGLSPVSFIHRHGEAREMADAINRRGLFGGLAAGAAAASLPASTLAGGQARDQLAPFGQEWSGQNWSRGLEGQRRADLDDGRFLNPIMAGDRPDPTILKDGDVYYMTFSSFESVPGLVIWRSTDLVNWTPVTAALKRYIGSVWAPELCR